VLQESQPRPARYARTTAAARATRRPSERRASLFRCSRRALCRARATERGQRPGRSPCTDPSDALRPARADDAARSAARLRRSALVLPRSTKGAFAQSSPLLASVRPCERRSRFETDRTLAVLRVLHMLSDLVLLRLACSRIERKLRSATGPGRARRTRSRHLRRSSCSSSLARAALARHKLLSHSSLLISSHSLRSCRVLREGSKLHWACTSHHELDRDEERRGEERAQWDARTGLSREEKKRQREGGARPAGEKGRDLRASSSCGTALERQPSALEDGQEDNATVQGAKKGTASDDDKNGGARKGGGRARQRSEKVSTLSPAFGRTRSGRCPCAR